MTQPESLTKEQYLQAIAENSALLAAAARRSMTVNVPTCPAWSVAELVAHIGEVQRFWALQVRERAREFIALPPSAFEACPGLLPWLDGADAGNPDLEHIPEGLIPWFEGATVELMDALEGTGPEEEIRHWSGDNRGITHMRNQAMEATVHRWDAEHATGEISPLDPAIVADGIEQHFDVQIPAARTWGKPIAGSGETYHFHATDAPGEWLIRFDGNDVTIRREHGKGDIAIRGPMEDLFLWLWGRGGTENIDVYGDVALLERYRQLVPGS
ncbi:MAG TPA: maleylpyruvate isomerase family mycothiol-dependent enzyme [Chloroflexota bacterium]|nr:maleylpyruvate isomerase family mycothiol-dependent enzyme [Chloroflexota bacterium]